MLNGDFHSHFHWIKFKIHQKKIEVGSDLSAEATVEWGQAARAFLIPDRGTLIVAVEYVATIKGCCSLTFFDRTKLNYFPHSL